MSKINSTLFHTTFFSVFSVSRIIIRHIQFLLQKNLIFPSTISFTCRIYIQFYKYSLFDYSSDKNFLGLNDKQPTEIQLDSNTNSYMYHCVSQMCWIHQLNLFMKLKTQQMNQSPISFWPYRNSSCIIWQLQCHAECLFCLSSKLCSQVSKLMVEAPFRAESE